MALAHDYLWPSDRMRVVGLDVETTGINRGRDRITQFGLCGNFIPRQGFLVDPETDTGNDPRRIKGITQNDISNMRPIVHYLDMLYAALHGSIVVIHNKSHDMAFIHHEFTRHGRQPPVPDRVVCTLQIIRDLKLPGSRGLKLVLERYNVPVLNHHNAASDAEAHYRLFIVLANRYWSEYMSHYFSREFQLNSRHFVRQSWLVAARLTV